MSLVRRGNFALDDTPQELADYPNGGVFVVVVDGSALGAQDLTIEAYTRAHQGSEEVLAKSATISGPTPADPSACELQIVTQQPVRFVAYLSTATPVDCPWRVESVGQVASIENGEDTVTADGTEQELATTLYAGTFLLRVDVSAMQAGDDLKLRLKNLIEAIYYVQKYVLLEDAPADAIYEFGPIVVSEKCRATLAQTAGSNRSYPWALVQVG